jgi:hypothetical protein
MQLKMHSLSKIEYRLDLEKREQLQKALDAIKSDTLDDWKLQIIHEKCLQLGVKQTEP